MRCRQKALRVIRQMCTELASWCSQTADAKGQRHTLREFACTHLAQVISPRFDVRQYTAFVLIWLREKVLSTARRVITLAH